MYKKSICITKIKGYSFTGDFDGEVSAEHLKLLGLDNQPEKVLLIEGDYSIEWDDDIAMPQIESIFLINPDDASKYVRLNFDDVDTESLEETISDSDLSSDWECDRMAEAADWAHDSYEDR